MCRHYYPSEFWCLSGLASYANFRINSIAHCFEVLWSCKSLDHRRIYFGHVKWSVPYSCEKKLLDYPNFLPVLSDSPLILFQEEDGVLLYLYWVPCIFYTFPAQSGVRTWVSYVQLSFYRSAWRELILSTAIVAPFLGVPQGLRTYSFGRYVVIQGLPFRQVAY